MRKVSLFAVLLALSLLLTACGGRFSRDEDGYGYTDTKTDRHYTVLDIDYEAARRGEELGQYKDKEYGVTTTFYRIPELEPDRFLTDGSSTVYCADSDLPDAASWTLTVMYIFEEDAVSMALAERKDAEQLLAVRNAWFDGESTMLPPGKADYARRIKLLGKEYPNLFYCFSFFVYEGKGAYFYSMTDRRAVLLSDEVTAMLYEEGEDA